MTGPLCDVCRKHRGAPRSQYVAAAALAPGIRIVCSHCNQATGHRAQWQETHVRPPKKERPTSGILTVR